MISHSCLFCQYIGDKLVISAAADKFDSIFEVDDNENSDPNVSKMLATSEDLASRPYRSRTCDTLIKSQGVSK